MSDFGAAAGSPHKVTPAAEPGFAGQQALEQSPSCVPALTMLLDIYQAQATAAHRHQVCPLNDQYAETANSMAVTSRQVHA